MKQFLYLILTSGVDNSTIKRKLAKYGKVEYFKAQVKPYKEKKWCINVKISPLLWYFD